MKTADDLDITISKLPRISGKCIDIRALAIGGCDEFLTFLLSKGYPHSATTADVKFLSRLHDILQQIGDLGQSISDQYFARLTSSGAGQKWPDVWEVRVAQGPIHHRFYGFIEGRVFYIVAYCDKQSKKADTRLLDRVSEVRSQWLRMRRARLR